MSPLKEACDSHLATKTNSELEDIDKPHLLFIYLLYLFFTCLLLFLFCISSEEFS